MGILGRHRGRRPLLRVASGAVAATSGPPTQVDAGNRGWRLIWRGADVLARRIGPVVQLLAAVGAPGYADAIVEPQLVGRRSGRPRPVLVTLIREGGDWYAGHPNGARAWLANLAAADSVRVRLLHGGTIEMRGG